MRSSTMQLNKHLGMILHDKLIISSSCINVLCAHTHDVTQPTLRFLQKWLHSERYTGTIGQLVVVHAVTALQQQLQLQQQLHAGND